METEVRRYRVIEAVGRGGFGTVYRAELVGPSGFRKEVALKVLNPDAPEAAGVAERLRDEARVLGMLRHRAIVQVDGLHLLGGRWTVVMEFVEGVDLKQLLAARHKVPPGVALEIVQEVANALHYAYEMSMDRSTSGVSPGSLRLLHRDIKPGNIQLTAAGEVKVLDFGVARADFADREAHTQSVYFGSLNYMSPERLDGIDDHKGDIYALGAVLYELVMGEPLGRTSASRERHDARLREALGKLWDQLPSEDLYRLIAECLLYDPDARPTARELERACRTLRPGFGAPWLSEWAEEQVPDLLEAREAIEDDLSGATLVEQGGVSGGVTDSVAEEVPAAPARPRGSGRGRVVAAAAGTALIVVVGGGFVIGTTLWPDAGPVPASAAVQPGSDAPAAGDGQADALDELGAALDGDVAQAPAVADPAAEPWFMDGVDDAELVDDADAAGVVDDAADPGTADPGTADPGTADAAPAAASDAGRSTEASGSSSQTAARSTAGSSTSGSSTASAAPSSSTTGGAASSSTTDAPSTPASSPATSSGSSSSGSSSTGATSTTSPSTGPSSASGATSTGTGASASSGSGNVRLLRAAAGLKVVLVDGSGSHPPGRLPAGRYKVRATFPDGTVNDSLSVDVVAGGTVTLTCNVGLKSCVKL